MRDLQAERAKRQSELAQHENLYGAALARADRTQLVIHHAKAAEAQAQLRWSSTSCSAPASGRRSTAW